ncbi:hypothetical protein SAMN02745181_3600, partial [Rubritalea squalenifaciens DSM 18772]
MNLPSVPRYCVTSPLAALALGISLFSVSSHQLGATQVNPPYTDPSGPKCGPCCEGGENVPTNPSGSGTNSLHWNVGIGVSRQDKDVDIQVLSRQPAVEGHSGGTKRTFEQTFDSLFHDDAIGRISHKLELDVADLSGDVFDPAVLKIASSGHDERIELNGFINQVLTDNAFTHVDKNTDGFRVRVWNRMDISLVKPSGETLYTVPTEDPLQDITFTKLADYQLQIVTKEDFGASGVSTKTQKFVQDTVNDTMTTYTYEGEGTGGTLVAREELTFSNRGARKWDYTIERKQYRADLNADGTYGAGTLDLINHTSEVYQDFSESTNTAGGDPGAKRLVSVVVDPGTGGAALTTT